jgi:hypothetical protein
MKTFFSILAQIGPIALVLLPLEWRNRRKKMLLLRHMGLAFAASGICSHFGAKHFDLAVFGRYSVIYGDDAAKAALFLAAFGAVLLAMHYLMCALFPRFMHVRENQKESQQSTIDNSGLRPSRLSFKRSPKE